MRSIPLVMGFLPHSTDQRERSAVPVRSAIQYAPSILKCAAGYILGSVNPWGMILRASQCILAHESLVLRLHTKYSCLKQCAIWLLARDLLLKTEEHTLLRAYQMSGVYFAQD